ncbi:MAG: 4-hydroxy-tetrahydrodipicolinate synthase [Sphingomonadales bacterium]|nr:4-hydroxy-tetrahydrodipicolinate synthase [Sphingomonadales bacterium]
MKEITGTGTALITPFKKDFSVDTAALSAIVEHQIANGTDYFVVLGTTGESATLSEAEKQLVIDTIHEANNGRLPLVLGIGGNNTAAVCHKMQHADLRGFSAILSVSPYYNKPNQEGIYHHYKTISDVAPLPVIIYNVPSRTGSNMTWETQCRIAELPKMVATKEASGNMEQVMQLMTRKPDNFLVISGDDALTFPMLACGTSGVISVINHAYPAQFSGMVKAALAGNWNEARKLHNQILEGALAIFADGSPGGIKVMLNEMGLCENVVRQPLWPVSDTVEKRLRNLVIR